MSNNKSANTMDYRHLVALERQADCILLQMADKEPLKLKCKEYEPVSSN